MNHQGHAHHRRTPVDLFPAQGSLRTYAPQSLFLLENTTFWVGTEVAKGQISAGTAFSS